MNAYRLLATIAACAALIQGAYATSADRLKELDYLKSQGMISEKDYNRRWKEIVELGIAPPVRNASQDQERGRTELSFSGSWLDLDAGGIGVSAASGDLTLGYFVTENLQLSFGGMALHADIEDIEMTAYGATVGADFHFVPTAQIVPYFGAGVTWLQAEVEDLDGDDWAWNVRAGFKQFVKPNVAIKYQAQYQSFDDLDLTGFALTVGLIFAF